MNPFISIYSNGQRVSSYFLRGWNANRVYSNVPVKLLTKWLSRSGQFRKSAREDSSIWLFHRRDPLIDTPTRTVRRLFEKGKHFLRFPTTEIIELASRVESIYWLRHVRRSFLHFKRRWERCKWNHSTTFPLLSPWAVVSFNAHSGFNSQVTFESRYRDLKLRLPASFHVQRRRLMMEFQWGCNVYIPSLTSPLGGHLKHEREWEREATW